MAARRKIEPDDKVRRPPATTLEGRENQLISLAVDLAEKQMREGTASSQTISHYLKLGSTREKLEQQRLSQENSLLQAKIEAMASAKRVEELYETALNAMRSYSGQDDGVDDDYDD
jgi:hypothetical protein